VDETIATDGCVSAAEFLFFCHWTFSSLTRIIQRGGVRSGDAADRGVIFRGVEDAGIGV
jgi:hypothetical protein